MSAVSDFSSMAQYCFPPQPLVISACAELARRIVRGNDVQGQATDLDEKPVKHKGLMTSWMTVSERGKEKVKDETKDERILVVVG
jgi:DNA cross-link repair 1A protein